MQRPAREHHRTPPTDAVTKMNGSVFVALCLKFAISGMRRFEIGPIVDIRVFSVRHCRRAATCVLVFRDKWTNCMDCGCKTWTIKARDARRITAAEMKYMRRTAGYTRTDYKINTQIAKELKITPILDKLLEYKRNWIQHVNRMPRNRLPRVMKHYSPAGKRNHGRPLKRLLDT